VSDARNEAASEPSSSPGRGREILAWILFGLAGCAFLYTFYVHLVLLTLPAPQEYRECAIVLSTDLLLHGENPYAVQNQPVYTNIYGIGYHLVMLPFAKVFGCTLIVHRAVSAVFVWASCALIFAALARAGVSRRLAFVGATLFYCDLAIRAAPSMRPAALPLTVLARPDAMGLFLFLLSVITPWWKNFSTRSLILSAAFAIAAFFTKPYFVLGFPIIAAYQLMSGPPRRGLVYGAATTGALAVILVLAVWLMPVYAADVLTGNRNATGQRIAAHLHVQLARYALDLPGLIMLFIVTLAVTAQTRRTMLFPFAAICSAVVLFAKLGRYGGNSMLYFYQLLSPLLILTAFTFAAGTASHQSRRLPLLLLLAIDFLLLPRSVAPPPARFDDMWASWSAQIAGKQNVYAPPPLAWILRSRNLPIYDAGLSDSFLYSMSKSVYPREEVLRRRYDQYIADVSEQVRQRKFDLIVLPYENDKPEFCFLPTELVQQNYRPVGRLEMPMSWQAGWFGVVWEPMVPK